MQQMVDDLALQASRSSADGVPINIRVHRLRDERTTPIDCGNPSFRLNGSKLELSHISEFVAFGLVHLDRHFMAIDRFQRVAGSGFQGTTGPRAFQPDIPGWPVIDVHNRGPNFIGVGFRVGSIRHCVGHFPILPQAYQ